jgi:hypothetical protein
MKDDTYYFHQTPPELAKRLIEFLPLAAGDIVLEPFKGEGAFYDNFPDNVVREWTEIEEGRDYTTFTGFADWVVSNPPFKLETGTGRVNSFWYLIKHYASIARTGLAFLGNDRCFSALTPKRMKELNALGFYLNSYKVCNAKAWRGRYFFLIFTKTPSEIGFLEGSY